MKLNKCPGTRLLKHILSYLPTKLPVGVTEFEAWSASIVELSGKFADEDSMKFAIATMILHLGPTKSTIPKRYFVRSLRKTAANQVAGQIFTDIKEKQKAAEAARLAEVTADKKAEDDEAKNVPTA